MAIDLLNGLLFAHSFDKDLSLDYSFFENVEDPPYIAGSPYIDTTNYKLGGGSVYADGLTDIFGSRFTPPNTTQSWHKEDLYMDATNNMTFAVWARPLKNINIVSESTSGAAGVSGQSYLVPSLNTTVYYYTWANINYTGLGLSVGNNGIMVIEHGNGLIPSLCTLEKSIPNDSFTFILIEVEAMQPKISVNNVLERVGLTSPRTRMYWAFVFAKLASYGNWLGNIDQPMWWNRLLTQEEKDVLWNNGDGLSLSKIIYPPNSVNLLNIKESQSGLSLLSESASGLEVITESASGLEVITESTSGLNVITESASKLTGLKEI